MNAIKIIGCDPSLRNFGIVKADLDLDTLTFKVTSMELVKSEATDAKTAKVVRKNSDDLNRATLLHDGFVAACDGASFAFAEVPVGSQSARAMASYGINIGVLAACPIPMIQVTPTEVKLAGTRIKTATKHEMIEAAMKAHPEALWLLYKQNGKTYKKGDVKDENEHLADAIFAIKAGLASEQFKQTLAMMRHLRKAA